MENKSEVRGEEKPIKEDQRIGDLAQKSWLSLDEDMRGDADAFDYVTGFNDGYEAAQSQSVELREENARLREALEKIEQHFKDHGWKSHEAMNIASEALNQIKKEESTPPEQPGEDQEALWLEIITKWEGIHRMEPTGYDTFVAQNKSKFTLTRK